MACCGQQCKQPCPPLLKCQQKSVVIDRLPVCTPPYRPQQQQSYTSWCIQPCPSQCRRSHVPQGAPFCLPPQQQPCSQSCPRQQRSCCSSRCIQRSCAPPCKSVSFNHQQSRAPQTVQQYAPKGKAGCVSRCLQGCSPQQCTMKRSQQCVIRSGQQYVSKEGPMCKTKSSQPCASQRYATMGGPVCITKHNQQNTSQPGITVRSLTCVTKSSQPCASQQCVPTDGPVGVTKGNQPCARKRSNAPPLHKLPVKQSNSGQKYCSAVN